jgi:hypothetical protein
MKFMKLKTRCDNLQRIKSYTGPPIVSEMIQNLTEIRPIHIHGEDVPSENYFLLGYYSASSGNSLPTFRVQFIGGTYRLSRNVGNELPLLAA